MYLKGKLRVDKKTKDLVKRVKPHEIALIDHRDLDEVAARSLAAAKVKAVVNVAPSISGYYPNPGPLMLLQAGIPLIDCPETNLFKMAQEGDELEFLDGQIIVNGRAMGQGHVLDEEFIKEKMEQSKENLNQVLSGFVENTLQFAQREIGLINGEYKTPEIRANMQGRHVLIVVRGKNYKEDLEAIRSYIEDMHPVLIGVDGGADALREFGFIPDVIVGDMDSISDDTLQCGAELVVHAYPDGRAPGLARLQAQGLSAVIYPAPGTSEDIAMLLAYENGADLIVAVGTHSNMLDFLEKGRKGMASTLLVRMKVGSILIDAKGVSKLYHRRIKARYLAEVVLAALIPFAIVLATAPATKGFLHLIFLQFRLIFGV